MPVTSLGNKFTCYSCQAKFYDLNRPEAICPKCKANQKDAPKPKPASRSRAVEKVKEEKKPVVVEPEVDEVASVEEEGAPGADIDEESDEDED